MLIELKKVYGEAKVGVDSFIAVGINKERDAASVRRPICVVGFVGAHNMFQAYF